jgi:acyl-coenzyme A thioesterase PaaI-like protein
MTLADAILEEPSVDILQLWLTKVPYAVYLGVRAEIREGEIVFVLPADQKLIGNPSLPALHGGVVGAFMEQAAAFHLIAKMSNPVLPKIIDFSLDYLRPARLQDTYAQCRLTRQGRFIANISITAWQEGPDKPNAIARAHFLIPESD